MPQVKGSDVVIGIGKETTFGQLPGTPDGKILPVVKFGLMKKQNRVQSKTLRASRGKQRSMLGNIDHSGSIDIELNAESTGMLFEQLMGTVAHSGAGPYTHTYTIGALPPGLWIDEDFGSALSGSGRYQRHNGVRISEATFTLNNEGPCDVSFSCVGVDVTAQAAPADATLTDNGFLAFSGFDAVIMDNAVTQSNIKSGTIKISNNLETDKYAFGGAGKRRTIPEGFAEVTGSITCYFEDLTLINKASSNTSSNLKVTFSRGNGLGTVNNESIELFVQNLDYTPIIPEVSGAGGVEVTFDFIGFASGVNLGLQIIVKNAIATF